MAWSRRAFVTGLSAAGLGTLVARSPAQEVQDGPALPVPPLLDAKDGPVRLVAQPGLTEFFAGRPTSTAGFNGSFLGPTVRLRSGSEAPVHVRNALPEATTVHWHGLLVPAEVDGGMHNEIAAGGEGRTMLPVRQPAMTGWYHAHPHMRTGPQVYAGLAGMLIVDDEASAGIALPSRYGVDDLPLVLQDRLFDRNGRMVYPRNHMTQMHGVHGNVMLVNGARTPRASVPDALVRLRLLNAANARVFDLAFDDGRSFHWIATDAGLLREPVTLQRLQLAPGQRAELLVDFSDGRAATLSNRGASAMARGRGIAQIALDPLVSFAPAKGQGGLRAVPARLARWDTPAVTPDLHRRRLTLTMGLSGMGHAHGMAQGIDGRAFAMDRIDQRVPLGAVEVWEVSSQPGMMMDQPHPFHIHGVHFEVLRRDGRPPGVPDAGRRDTVLVDAPVELLVRFTQPAGERAPFMYHCHILEHEDAGMMGQFTVA